MKGFAWNKKNIWIGFSNTKIIKLIEIEEGPVFRILNSSFLIIEIYSALFLYLINIFSTFRSENISRKVS